MTDAFIYDHLRSPRGRGKTDGSLHEVSTVNLASQVLKGVDPAAEPQRAKAMHDSHLARARWMTEVGYAHLLGSERPLDR